MLGIDETSTKKGYNYVTVGVEMDSRRAVFATPGKDAAAIEKLVNHLKEKGTTKEAIEQVSIDMSGAFIS